MRYYRSPRGSILALYNTNGDVVWQTSYDAWGRERNVTDGGYLNITPRPVWLVRGYTGHEHLPEFRLINMNGRMYDPVLGRMLSPDNFIQDATSVRGYNRYAYVWNNL
jgi:RHS repeat-associated protein